VPLKLRTWRVSYLHRSGRVHSFGITQNGVSIYIYIYVYVYSPLQSHFFCKICNKTVRVWSGCRPVHCIGNLVQAGAVYWLVRAGRCSVLAIWCRPVQCIGNLVQAGALYWLADGGRCGVLASWCRPVRCIG
jgi:hypothetical protein